MTSSPLAKETPPSEPEAFRSDLIGLGYRMLGSWTDAQEIAQETLARWHTRPLAERARITAPRSWLFKTASRLCLDLLKSARKRRETYVGPWLPEPWLVEERSPADEAEFDESVTLAMMVALERLSPGERAAFILGDVFGFHSEEVGELLGKSSAACRKLASRARSALRLGETRFECEPAKHRKLLEAFLAASSSGDMEGLKAVLADDVALHSDGGGVARAARKILRSSDVVARLFLGLSRKARRSGALSQVRFGVANGLPAALLFEDGRLATALSISVSGGRIQSIYQQRNPNKLRLLENALAGGEV